MNTYQEVVNWMFDRLPMYQRLGKSAFKGKLDNIRLFSEYLGHPEKQFGSIHIAGTNGKGSTSHMMASVLQEAGYKTGLYTSPHLKDFRERIRINGLKIPEASVIGFINKHKDFLEANQLSFFEMTVAMAFDYFANEKIDIAVIETGLGGRLDSTNIINPLISVITNIGFDHTDMLGDTLAKIAAEKAGIIKQNVPVVIGEYHQETFPVFESKSKDSNAELIKAFENTIPDFECDLKGLYQSKNIRTVYTTLKNLKGFEFKQVNFETGFQNVIKNTGLRGRWEKLKESPLVICDVAHNKEGLELAVQQIATCKFDKLHLVLGVVREKKLEDILPLFPKTAQYYFCKPNVPRGLDAVVLQEKAKEYGLKGDIFNSVSEAYQSALEASGKGDFIYVGGSTFTVAEII